MNGKNIKRIIDLMQTDDSVDAPPDAVKWVQDLYRTRAASKPSLAARILAVLQMDIAPGKPVAGERSATLTEARQMLFTAGDKAIDLRISAGKRGSSIHGQLLGDYLSDVSVRLIGDKHRYKTVSDAQAEFHLDSVEVGVYEMEIDVAGQVIAIEKLELF